MTADEKAAALASVLLHVLEFGRVDERDEVLLRSIADPWMPIGTMPKTGHLVRVNGNHAVYPTTGYLIVPDGPWILYRGPYPPTEAISDPTHWQRLSSP